MAPSTLLFDLDGTLLPLDSNAFLKLYFQELTPYFADAVSPKDLVPLILGSLEAMVADLSPRRNDLAFMEIMSQRCTLTEAQLRQRFDEFYATGFPRAQAASSKSASMQEAVRLLRTRQIPLVLATNPIFPRTAVLQRIAWAGLEPSDFVYISTFESSSYCKPHLQYYEEVLAKVGVSASDCLMVGNDTVEDLVVAELGIPTYLVTDWPVARNVCPYSPTYRGSAQDFLEFVRSLG